MEKSLAFTLEFCLTLRRLTKMDNRKINEVLAEMSSAYLLESILNLKVTGWEMPTSSDKNVDFTIDLNSE